MREVALPEHRLFSRTRIARVCALAFSLETTIPSRAIARLGFCPSSRANTNPPMKVGVLWQ